MSDKKPVRESLRGGNLSRMLRKMADDQSPEMSLLCAILEQAIVDSLGPSKAYRESADDYFRRNRHKGLCETIGINPDAPVKWIASFRAKEATENIPTKRSDKR